MFELTPVVWLLYTPCTLLATATVIVQVPPAAAIAPPERLIAPDPAVAPLTVPPQVLVSAGVAPTTSPEGKVSLKASVVMPPTVALLVIVSESVVTPVPGLVEKLFAIDGV